jgi:hypothetical protein
MEKIEYDPKDTECVVNAANYLEVSEFMIFKDAYTAWYGREMPAKQVEKIFVQYLQENKVPFWVRNYARTQVPEEFDMKDRSGAESRLANNLLYLATIIIEYVILASYLVMR